MNLTKNNIEKLSALEKIANGAMWWIGSIPSLIAHTIFFIVSFALPILGIVDFDKNAFGAYYCRFSGSYLSRHLHSNVC
nr:hypothetical protein LJIDIMOD_00026 [uncultured bacterium]